MGEVVEDLSFEDAAWVYPGRKVAHSGLLHEGRYLRLGTGTGTGTGPLGTAQLTDEPDPVRTLDAVLTHSGRAPVAERVLVVAVGSNASAGVMQAKFGRAGVSTTVPFLTAHVEGVQVSHAAFVAGSGFVPTAPAAVGGVRQPVVASLLDDDQLACLDATEPNYRRVRVDADRYPLVLDADIRPECYYLYDSVWGVLAPAGKPVGLLTQDQVFAMLLTNVAAVPVHRASTPAATVRYRAVMRALAADEALRTSVRERHLLSCGWVAPSGLGDLPVDEAPARFGDHQVRPAA